MPQYSLSIRQRLAATIAAAEIDEEHALAASLDVCRGWHAGLGLFHAQIPLAPLVETRVAADVVGVYGAVRLLCQMRAATDLLLEPEERAGTWMGADLSGSLDYLFLSLIEQQGGRFLEADRSRFRGGAGPGQLEAPLEGLSPVSISPRLDRPGGALVIASTERYLNPLLAVLAPLCEQAPVALLAPREARQWPILRQFPPEVQTLFVEDGYTPAVAEVLAEWTARGRRVWEERRDLLRELFRVEGISLFELFEAGVEALLTRFLPHAAAYVEMAQRLFAAGQPGVVITAKLTRSVEHAFFAVAEQRGTKRMQVMHGNIVPYPHHFFVQGRFADADRVCLWGEYYLRVLVRHLGEDLQRKAVVTGNPGWDYLIRRAETLPPRATLRQEAARCLQAPEDAFWVTYLDEPISQRQYAPVQAAVAAIPNAFLIVKVHPAEEADWYRQRLLPALAGRAAVFRTHPELDLHRLLRASDAAVTYSSTTGLESVLVGTPIIWAAFDPYVVGRFPTVDWSEYGFPVARSVPELAQMLHAFADDEQARGRALDAARAGLLPFVRNADGGSATDAVLGEILGCLEGLTNLVGR